MARLWTSLLVPVLACVAASVQAADPPQKTGAFTASFSERSEFSTSRAVNTRLGWSLPAADAANAEYRLPEESFEVVVPADYTGEKPFGLLIFVNPHPRGNPPRGYLEAAAKHHLIYVGPNNAGNDRFVQVRMGLAIDAVHNLKARYAIDPERVYVSGVSGGGRTASMLGVGFADVFRGGIYIIGANSYAAEKSIEKPGRYYRQSYKVPPANVFQLARKQSRHVFVTGDLDENREPTWVCYKGFERDKFEHITYYQVPGMGHRPPDADWFDAALAFVDRPVGPATKPTVPKRPVQAASPPATVKPVVPRAAATRPVATTRTNDREAVAAALLVRAKLYVDNKVVEQARERLTWIVTNYPETAAAGEARVLLKRLASGG